MREAGNTFDPVHWDREDRSASKLLQRTGAETSLTRASWYEDRSLVSFSDYSHLGTRLRKSLTRVHRPRVM